MAIERHSNVTYTRWADLRAAITTLIGNGTYKRLADIHARMDLDADGFAHARHRMHGAMYGPVGMRRFLPWHRAYLIAVERAIRGIDPTLSMPYWDWHADGGRLVGFAGFLGLSNGRDLGTLPGQAPQPGRAGWFVDSGTFDLFTEFTGAYYTLTQALEIGSRALVGPHGAGHNWIGGDMANIQISPNDPVFWFHHVQVDRVWAKWQTNNPGELAALTGREARLDPWGNEFTVRNIDDIADLGDDSYEYIDP